MPTRFVPRKEDAPVIATVCRSDVRRPSVENSALSSEWEGVVSLLTRDPFDVAEVSRKLERNVVETRASG